MPNLINAPSTTSGIGYILYIKGKRTRTVGPEALEFLEEYAKTEKLKAQMLGHYGSSTCHYLLFFKDMSDKWIAVGQEFSDFGSMIPYLSPSRLRVIVEYSL